MSAPAAALWLVLAAASALAQTLLRQPAISAPAVRRGPSSALLMRAEAGDGQPTRSRRAAGVRLGWGSRIPDEPVVGPRARVQWWERGRSIITLAVLVIGLGVLLAAVIGGAIFLTSYVLEQSVS